MHSRADNTVANAMVVGGGNHRSVNSVGGEVLGVSLSLSRNSHGKKNLGGNIFDGFQDRILLLTKAKALIVKSS